MIWNLATVELFEEVKVSDLEPGDQIRLHLSRKEFTIYTVFKVREVWTPTHRINVWILGADDRRFSSFMSYDHVWRLRHEALRRDP